MKRLLKITAVIVIMFCALYSSAQNKIKVGYINSDSLMLVMPGIDSTNAILQAEYKTYQTKLTAMQEELNTKYTAYQTNLASMSALIKETSMAELQDLNARIETFSASADSTLPEKKA
jgi:outer membrane protein